MKKCKWLVFLPVLVLIFNVGCYKPSLIDKVSKNITSYSIVANLQEDKTLIATEQVVFYNSTQVPLDYACFYLYATAFSEDAKIKPYFETSQVKCFPEGVNFGDIIICSVKVENNDQTFEIIGEDYNILKIYFGKEVYPECSINLEIKFTLLLAKCEHRLGYSEHNINLGNWYPILCEYENGEYLMNAYYATGDPFYSSIANYDICITYPEKYTLVSTGERTIESIVEGLITANYNARAVRDFAMVFSDNLIKVSDENDGVIINYYGYSEDEDLEKCLAVSKQALETFNNLFGKYPYKEINIVKTSFMHGGMEYPNIVFISDSIKDFDYYLNVIVHEIAHQWWYSTVGNNEIDEAWLDESLAEYSTLLFYENNPDYGKTREQIVKQNTESYMLYVDVIDSINGKINTSMQLKVNEYINEYEYVYMVYVKGLLMIDNLRTNIGDKAFFSGIKNYYQTNMFKIAHKDDFIACFEKATNTDLSGFFDSWLDGKVNILQT